MTTGERVAVRLTVLLKPFTPRTEIVNKAEDPLAVDWEDGLAAIVKSGAGTVNLTATE